MAEAAAAWPRDLSDLVLLLGECLSAATGQVVLVGGQKQIWYFALFQAQTICLLFLLSLALLSEVPDL